MSVRARKLTPAVLDRLGRRAYGKMCLVTAPLRLQPAFLLIGAQRCGTTSLFRALSAHPQAVPPVFRKGINYFDLNYHRGPGWYRGHFPVSRVARWRAVRHGEPAAFEASGYYLYHPLALPRIASDLPAVRLVVMLRDPVERAYSAYRHEYARGYERETFEKAIELEARRLAGETNRMRDDPAYESFPHRHHSYLHRGHYAEQLERVFQLFPRAQVHVIVSESYFACPELEYERLLDFLGLRRFRPAFGRHNARPGPPMAARTRRVLEEYYAPHNERLASLLGQHLPWASPVTSRGRVRP